MTSLAAPDTSDIAHPGGRTVGSYRHAHWFLLAAFGVVFIGFWPTFYRPLSGSSTLVVVHGITATLWYLALITQSWLVAHGLVAWHRRVAAAVVALLPVLAISALMTTQVMLTRSRLPLPVRPLIAFLDITLTSLFVTSFVLGLINRRDPTSHKRYMVTTALLGFPPALTRFISRSFASIQGVEAIHVSFWTVEAILVVLILTDWRMGVRRRLAYPLALAVHVAVQSTMVSVSTAEWWVAFCQWFAAA